MQTRTNAYKGRSQRSREQRGLVQLNVAMPPDIIEPLRDLAYMQRVTLSEIVERALRAELAAHSETISSERKALDAIARIISNTREGNPLL
jgi:hypothetical protein